MNEQIEKTIAEEKDTHIQLLKESMWDVRDQRNFFKKMNLILCLLLFFAIGGLTAVGIYNQKVLKDITFEQIEQQEKLNAIISSIHQ